MIAMETMLDDLLKDDDWAEVFADKNSGNVDKSVEPAPPHSKVSIEPVSRSDVSLVIAAVNGSNDGPDWLGLFALKDGRFLVASGGCDYTGWDCRAFNNLVVSASLEDAIRFGLTPEEQLRLGLRDATAEYQRLLEIEQLARGICRIQNVLDNAADLAAPEKVMTLRKQYFFLLADALNRRAQNPA